MLLETATFTPVPTMTSSPTKEPTKTPPPCDGTRTFCYQRAPTLPPIPTIAPKTPSPLPLCEQVRAAGVSGWCQDVSATPALKGTPVAIAGNNGTPEDSDRIGG